MMRIPITKPLVRNPALMRMGSQGRWVYYASLYFQVAKETFIPQVGVNWEEEECVEGTGQVYCSKMHCLCRKEPDCYDLNDYESGSGYGEEDEEDKGKDKDKNKDKDKDKDNKKEVIPKGLSPL